MNKISVLIFILCIFLNFSLNSFSKIKNLESSDFKIILSSQNMKEEKNEFLDINTASEIEMLGRKISSSYIEKILSYRNITGGFENLQELKRIKGIGNATYLKLTRKLKVLTLPEKKNLDINYANEEVLKYFGLTKKEIKNIKKFIEKNGKITNNIELKKIINKSTYEKLKNNIDYN